MRIVVLSRSPRIYSTDRLSAVACERGHETFIVDPLGCTLSIMPGRPSIHYRGETFEGVGGVIPRLAPALTHYGAALVRQFEMMGVFCLNGSAAIARSRDKLTCLQILSRKGINLPRTGFAHATRSTDDLIDLVGGPPLVVKLLEGTQGIGVVLAETRKASHAVIEAFRSLKANFLVQEFIQEAGGKDLRCFVIGKEVAASMLRRGGPGEFRSNIHRGGSGSPADITAEEQALAVRAARAMGLRVAGVDLLRSNRGPMVLEVNSSPGLEEIEQVSKMDVAAKIIDFLEAEAPCAPH